MTDDLKLSEQELEILKNYENARLLEDLMRHPGWDVFIALKDTRLEQIKNQFLKARVDKELLWAMHVRFTAIEEFVNILLDGMKTAVESLDPVVIRQVIAASRANRADLEGEIGLPEL